MSSSPTSSSGAAVRGGRGPPRRGGREPEGGGAEAVGDGESGLGVSPPQRNPRSGCPAAPRSETQSDLRSSRRTAAQAPERALPDDPTRRRKVSQGSPPSPPTRMAAPPRPAPRAGGRGGWGGAPGGEGGRGGAFAAGGR